MRVKIYYSEKERKMKARFGYTIYIIMYAAFSKEVIIPKR